ncbi:isochorismatase family protein [Tenggerimyces flavus]|uniref:Isochorismatase family protein n=1 Tax=Tenggerimyces flavus TaxID=1708749 RepID=A0ABV7Y469_9ACTN|nr:isochorismatase family protein [Tenggerimyces flavus]MBM7788540.1 nicotinamidase-related amidase [Tenggerimyces flavus]
MTELDLDPATTALVLIDLQVRLVTRPFEPRSGAEVVDAGRQLADAFRTAAAPVVLVRAVRPVPMDFSSPDDPQNQVVPELGTPDVLITKHTWGAFHQTPLDSALRERGIDTIVLGGVATNMGVESTARAADEHDYRLVFVEDAMSGLAADEHAFAVARMFPLLGTVTTTAAVVARLSGS